MCFFTTSAVALRGEGPEEPAVAVDAEGRVLLR